MVGGCSCRAMLRCFSSDRYLRQLIAFQSASAGSPAQPCSSCKPACHDSCRSAVTLKHCSATVLAQGPTQPTLQTRVVCVSTHGLPTIAQHIPISIVLCTVHYGQYCSPSSRQVPSRWLDVPRLHAALAAHAAPMRHLTAGSGCGVPPAAASAWPAAPCAGLLHGCPLPSAQQVAALHCDCPHSRLRRCCCPWCSG